MSTILDALKKVEGERPQSPHEQPLHIPDPSTSRRRPLSIGTIVACAALGFAAGIGLALWRNAPPLPIDEFAEPTTTTSDAAPEQALMASAPAQAVTAPAPAALAPGPAAAPAVAEPTPPGPAPVVAEPAPAIAAAAPAVPAAEPAPSAAPATGVEPVAAVLAASRDRGTAGGPPNQAAVAQQPAPGVGPAPRPGVPASGAMVADSALEPSPFTLPRPGAPAPAPAPEALVARAPIAPRAVPAAPPPADAMPAPDAMAAPVPAPQNPIATEPEPAPAPATVIDTGRSPPGAPRVALSFLQWSPDPARRFAFVSVDGAPSQRIREGDTPGGLTVAQITPTGVQFKRDGNLFTIRPRH